MPLVISRVGTVYSLTQLGESEEAALKKVPGRDMPVPAKESPVRQIRGSSLPTYRFSEADVLDSKRIRSFGDLQQLAAGGLDVPDVDEPSKMSSDEEFLGLDGSSDSSSTGQIVPQRSVLDNLTLAEWEDRAEQGLFRYDVTACPTKSLSGAYGFIAQLNEGRASKKRPTEFQVDLVNQPFDDSKFHFCKAMQREVLFQFQPASSRESRGSCSLLAPVEESPNLVLINVSPIEYGHILLVPRVLDNLNQLVGPDTLLLALRYAREVDNPYFRMGFNSLGAYATINHLHFQGYYLAAPMPLERAPTVPLPAKTSKYGPLFGRRSSRNQRVQIFQLSNYPVRGLVFEAGSSLNELATLVGTACERLTANNIPHNIMIVDRGARVFLLPNAFAERKARGEVPDGKTSLHGTCLWMDEMS